MTDTEKVWNWINVKDRMPRIGDSDYDGDNCDGTSVVFWMDGDVYTGWPLEDNDAESIWETSEHAIQIGGVEWWAKIVDPPEQAEAPG